MCEQMALSFTLRSQHIQKQAALTVLRYQQVCLIPPRTYQYLHQIATTLKEVGSSTYRAGTPHFTSRSSEVRNESTQLKF